MKLLDKALNRVIEFSKPVQELAKAVESLALNVSELAKNITILAHNQAVHHHMIQQMWQVQQAVLSKASEHSIDAKMPSLSGKDSKKTDKPN